MLVEWPLTEISENKHYAENFNGKRKEQFIGSMPLTLSLSPILENGIWSFIYLRSFLWSTYYLLGIELEAVGHVVNTSRRGPFP